jgi:cell division protein FtsI/penicillin-binding protein 2
LLHFAIALLLLGSATMWLSLSDSSQSAIHTVAQAVAAEAGEAETDEVLPVEAPIRLDPARFELRGEHYVQVLDDGRTVHLTLDAKLQKDLEKKADPKKLPSAGVVAIEPSTGRVLALLSRSDKKDEPYALRATAPAASVFKLVTASALLEMAQLDPNVPVCYSGGSQYLTERTIRGDAATDTTCANLEDAVGHSINAVIARLALQHLQREHLEEIALRFGFNREIPFELPVDVSKAEFSDDPIERARTAAGFWNVNLSALHGAMIAAALANGGVMMVPTLVDRVEYPDGHFGERRRPKVWLSSVSTRVAEEVGRMSESTTTQGTAAKTFQGRSDWPKDLRVGGKTGTLANRRPYVLFTWFVGFAPLDAPNIAVGAVVANGPKWWMKGTHLAAHAILSYAKSEQ